MMKAISIATLIIAASTQAAEYHVSKDGTDRNAGSVSQPLLTIQRAAELALPGDTITVHQGIYRERVNPPRGGTSDVQRIVYQSAPGETVIIKGSEVVMGWEKVKEDIWTVSIPNSFFGEFNPFADLIQGHWFDPKDRDHHTGAVYLNGHWLAEAADLEAVLVGPTADSDPLWFALVEDRNTIIHAQFSGVDPNRELVEVNARRTVFYPDQPGQNYITVRGFTLTQAATSWSPPTQEQIGLIGTHWSKGWVIEDNTINYSICTGLTLGLSDMGDYLGNLTGYTRMIQDAMGKGGWNKENVGSHLVRGNKISQCEQAGICGSLGGAFSVIENNEVSYIHVRQLFKGQEQGGIKLHGAVDTVIRNNLVHDAPRALWLDWMGQGAEVSGNVAFNNSTDLYLEVNHGPALVANNILLSPLAVSSKSRGTAFVHNLFGGRLSAGTTTRTTPYLEPHGTLVEGYHANAPGDDRFYNNIYVGKRPTYAMFVGEYNDPELPVTMQGNLYIRGMPYAAEVDPMVSNARPNLKAVQKPDGIYLEWTQQAEWSDAYRQIVTSELLGYAGVSGARFEHADGSPIRVDQDYFGHLRNQQNPMPGPFELPAGTVQLKIWPKTGE
ncbi:MAG: alpha-N-arabinofuranosidase [Lentimonas sp.]|jgi:alpha-N-arabinofuranosidase